jgi:hypothetical protein
MTMSLQEYNGDVLARQQQEGRPETSESIGSRMRWGEWPGNDSTAGAKP